MRWSFGFPLSFSSTMSMHTQGSFPILKLIHTEIFHESWLRGFLIPFHYLFSLFLTHNLKYIVLWRNLKICESSRKGRRYTTFLVPKTLQHIILPFGWKYLVVRFSYRLIIFRKSIFFHFIKEFQPKFCMTVVISYVHLYDS